MTTTKLPDFNGEPVVSTAIKFTGVGTGFTGIEVRPIVMELDDIAYFVVKVRAAESASHYRDKNGGLVRMQRVHADDMAPISEEVAQQALLAYVREVEAAKAALDGQGELFRDDESRYQGNSGIHPDRAVDDEDDYDDRTEAEKAAEAAEELDDTGTPAEIADAAKARASNVIRPAFSNPPAAGGE